METAVRELTAPVPGARPGRALPWFWGFGVGLLVGIILHGLALLVVLGLSRDCGPRPALQQVRGFDAPASTWGHSALHKRGAS